jgi:hypothetical protein
MHAEMLLTGGAMGGAQLRAASIVPMQTFSLRAEATSQQELLRQMAYTFYKTLLSCGRGLVYTLDLANGGAFAGMPMSRALKDTHAFVIGSPLGAVETRNLRALGALQSTFVLGAVEALAHMPPLMPLALQQRMQFCPLRRQLAQLTPAELAEAKHGCGMLAQTAVLDVVDGTGAAELNGAVANMQALHSAAQQIVGRQEPTSLTRRTPKCQSFPMSSSPTHSAGAHGRLHCCFSAPPRRSSPRTASEARRARCAARSRCACTGWPCPSWLLYSVMSLTF